MLRFAPRLITGVLLFLALLCGQALADQLKDQAVSRLATSLNPAIPVALGKTVVRQAGLVRARELLAEYGKRVDLDKGWNASAPEWQAAEAELVQDVAGLLVTRIETPEWFYAVLNREIARALNAEDADYIATHFSTPVGEEQRILLELRLIGEVLMANYTFTGRIDHTISGLEGDLSELQTAYWKLEPFRVRDFMNDPQAIRFAGQDAGLKYTRMLAIRGIEGFISHIDAVAATAREAVENAQPLIEEYVVAYQRRVGAGQ